MTFSRVTLVGERRRADVVLPAAEPIGRLLPEVLRLLGDRVESPPEPRVLVTADGLVLDVEASLAQAMVPDGTVLRLVRLAEAPAAPVVHDVAEETSDDLDGRSWRWGPVPRRWTATLLGLVALTYAAILFANAAGNRIAPLTLAAVALVVCTTGGVIATLVDEPVGTAVAMAGGGVGVVAVWAAARASGWSGMVVVAAVAWVAVVLLLVLGASAALGRGGLAGAGFTAVLAAVWSAGSLSHLPDRHVAGIVAVVVTVSLGVLPRLALVSSGIASLDDRRAGGAVVARREVGAALAAAHRGLVLATLAAAAFAGAAGWVLAARLDQWSVALALLLAFVLAGRSRIFPLAPQVMALQAAAVAVVGGVVTAWASSDSRAAVAYGPAAAATVVALALLLALALRPSEHLRARLRRLCDLLEAAAVIAVVPVTIGLFGTYDRLLHVVAR
jgi:type VII secretion integral membrane protein EccD